MMLSASFRGRSSISMSTADKRIVFSNDDNMAYLGRPERDIIGRDWREWMISDAIRALMPSLEKFLASKKPYEVVSHFVHSDGRLVPFVASCSCIKGELPEKDLLFCEMRLLNDLAAVPEQDPFRYAEYVRDLTYELAAVAGRHKLSGLTEALVNASGSAEYAVEILARAASTTAR